MTRPRHLATALATLCVLITGCGTGHTHPHRASTTTTATRLSERSLNPRAAGVRPVRRESSHAVAVRFAAAYARYLQGRLPAWQLPACPTAAQTMIEQSGPLPAPLRAGQLRLIGVHGADRSWSARFRLIHAAGRLTLTAGLTLTPTPSGWQLRAVNPPDPDTVLVAPRPTPTPAGPADARAAALAFTTSWLAFTYQRASPARLQDLTTSLRSRLAADPPRVPLAIHALTPRVASLALQRDHMRWTANANVTDGQNTYQVTTRLARVHGRWLVIALPSAG
jgi:hypothetical protein